MTESLFKRDLQWSLKDPLKRVFKKDFKRVNFILKNTLAQASSCEFCEISKNTFPYRTAPVAASEFCNDIIKVI